MWTLSIKCVFNMDHTCMILADINHTEVKNEKNLPSETSLVMF
jgi:hypothetical protein